MHGVMRFVGDASGVSLGRPMAHRKRTAEGSDSRSVPQSPASVAAQQPSLKHPRRHAPPPPATVPTAVHSLSAATSSDDGDDDEDEEEQEAQVQECENVCVDEHGVVGFVPVAMPALSLGLAARIDPAPSTSTVSIRLNVGGVLHQTSLQTLLSPAAAGSYFTARFSSSHFRERASPFDGAFFIDRDGTHFRHILNWLRDASPVALSDLDSLCQLKMEADFYQINGLQAFLAERIADMRLRRMRMPDSPSRRAAPLPPPPPPVSRPIMPVHAAMPGHRNLFVSNWGAPQTLLAHSSAPFAHAPQSDLQSHLQQLPSLLQRPPHSAHIPVRTHSCPSYTHADAAMAPSAAATPRRTHFDSPHPMHDLDCTPIHQRTSGGYNSDSDDEDAENRQQVLQQQQQKQTCTNSFEFSIDEDF